MCVQCPWRSEEGVGCPGPGVTDSCYPPYRCWELDPEPLEEQLVLLPLSHVFRPPRKYFFCLNFLLDRWTFFLSTSKAIMMSLGVSFLSPFTFFSHLSPFLLFPSIPAIPSTPVSSPLFPFLSLCPLIVSTSLSASLSSFPSLLGVELALAEQVLDCQALPPAFVSFGQGFTLQRKQFSHQAWLPSLFLKGI